jgi:hypothetical protein
MRKSGDGSWLLDAAIFDIAIVVLLLLVRPRGPRQTAPKEAEPAATPRLRKLPLGGRAESVLPESKPAFAARDFYDG